MERDDATAAEQPDGLVEVARLVGGAGVDEHQVVRAVGEPGQHLQAQPVDQPEPGRPVPGGGERLPGGTLALGIDVDRGEHTVGGHPAQQPQPADADPRADLDDRSGGGARSEKAQPGARPGLYRGAPAACRRGPRGGEHVVLCEVPLDVLAQRPRVGSAVRAAGHGQEATVLALSRSVGPTVGCVGLRGA